jgi:hypothetical protein
MEHPRRIMLKRIAVLAAAPWAARSALAQSKATKQAMQYQEQPKNGQRCDTCLQFVAGPKPNSAGTCKVVEGPISPNGWCIAYVKKG